MDYLKGLNNAQYEAVTSLQGPLMVLAGVVVYRGWVSGYVICFVFLLFYVLSLF